MPPSPADCGSELSPALRINKLTPALKQVFLDAAAIQQRSRGSLTPEHILSVLLQGKEGLLVRVFANLKLNDSVLRGFVLSEFAQLAQATPQTTSERLVPSGALVTLLDRCAKSSPTITEELLLLAMVSSDGKLGQAFALAGLTREQYLKGAKALGLDVVELTKLMADDKSDGLTKDLVAEAAANRTAEPLIGRRDELLQLVRGLIQRVFVAAPLLVGDRGVGKTAIVSELARLIAIGDNSLPEGLKKARILELDLAILRAGTKHHGELPEKVRRLFKILEDDSNLILYIPNIESLLGTDGSADQLAELFIGALSAKKFRIIAECSRQGLKEIERRNKDLLALLGKIEVATPHVEQTIEIVKGVIGFYSRVYGKKISISDEAARSLVLLTNKVKQGQLIGKFQPTAALFVLDSICAGIGSDKTELSISEKDINSALSSLTGIALSDLSEDEATVLLKLGDRLNARVIGQDHASSALEISIRSARLNLDLGRKGPIATFVFAGTTGNGKTETAKALARTLFLEEEALITVNMSEYGGQTAPSKLIGADPGYVGYGAGTHFINAVKARPSAVVLLDEADLANPEIWKIFYQIFDEGYCLDSSGSKVDFSNIIFILATNLGQEYFTNPALIQARLAALAETAKQKFEALDKGSSFMEKFVRDVVLPDSGKFTTAFLNRLDRVIVFNLLTVGDLVRIARIKLAPIISGHKKHHIELVITDAAIEAIAKESHGDAYGAREMRRFITDHILARTSDMILKSLAEETAPFKEGDQIIVDFKDSSFDIKEVRK